MTKVIFFLAVIATMFFFGSCSKNTSGKDFEYVIVNDSTNDDIKAWYAESPIPVGNENFVEIQNMITKYGSNFMSETVDSNVCELTVVKYGEVYNNAPNDAVKDSVLFIIGKIFYNGVRDKEHTVWFYIQRNRAFPYMIPSNHLDRYKSAVKRTYNYLLAQATK